MTRRTDANARSKETDAAPSRTKRLRNVLVAGWLLVQVTVPVRAFFVREQDARADFTWDMFSVRRVCEVCRFYKQAPDGSRTQVPMGRYFAAPPQVGRIRYPDRMAEFARHLCRVEGFRGAAPDVRIVCRCRFDDGPPEDLADENRNYCEAGVR